METGLRKKYFIVMRHSERSDRVGLIPKLHKFDPELTDYGKRQAYEMGEIIRKKLFESEQNDFKLDPTKILFLSSPFARTLQTAKHFAKGLLKLNDGGNN